MAIDKVAFQQFIAQWADDIKTMCDAMETWADNKQDNNPAFDYTTAQANLTSAKSAFETSVATVNAL